MTKEPEENHKPARTVEYRLRRFAAFFVVVICTLFLISVMFLEAALSFSALFMWSIVVAGFAVWVPVAAEITDGILGFIGAIFIGIISLFSGG